MAGACILAFLGQMVFLSGLVYSWVLGPCMAFLAGVQLKRAGDVPSAWNRVMISLQFVIPISLFLLLYFKKDRSFLCLALLLWIWSFTAKGGIVSRLFASKPLRYAGGLSYSFYLLHWCVFGYGGILLMECPVIQEKYLQIYVLVIWAILLALSALCYHFIEEPMRRKLRRQYPQIKQLCSFLLKRERS